MWSVMRKISSSSCHPQSEERDERESNATLDCTVVKEGRGNYIGRRRGKGRESKGAGVFHSWTNNSTTTSSPQPSTWPPFCPKRTRRGGRPTQSPPKQEESLKKQTAITITAWGERPPTTTYLPKRHKNGVAHEQKREKTGRRKKNTLHHKERSTELKT